jgi:hypothetical protein
MKKKDYQSKIFLFITLIILFSDFISAPKDSPLTSPEFNTAKDFVGKILDSSIGILSPIFEGIIGDYSTSEFFFAKILLLILLFLIINFVLKKSLFNEKENLSMTVAGVISILAVRFISENQLITGILLPYGTLGVALTAILPFLIFFYFIHLTRMNGFGRRLFWVFFAIVFLALWFSRKGISPIMDQIYIGTFSMIILAFVFDKRIHTYFKTWEINLFFRNTNERAIASLQAEYLNILDVNTNEARSRRAFIRGRIRELGGRIP